ncbi:MAG TPA: hypothetical protein VNO26_10520 [Candidatus Limnocylindria bacterium]|nr:hypothetical protein [Candidatus Limnocylindria bacterium]
MRGVQGFEKVPFERQGSMIVYAGDVDVPEAPLAVFVATIVNV